LKEIGGGRGGEEDEDDRENIFDHFCLVEYLIDVAMSQFENSDETLFSAAITCIVMYGLKIEITVISCT